MDRATARRIDRLARRAHLFHRFAHHPLCAEYSGELIRIGARARICRGCAWVGVGAVGGALVGVALPSPSPAASVAALAGAAALAWRALARPRRTTKLLTRGLPAALLFAAAASAVRAGGGAGVLFGAISAALIALAVAAYRRRGPDRSPCATCPERDDPRVCSGFRAIARREAAFARVAGRWIRG